MRESGGSDDWSPVTDFEKSSHQALHNMIANAQPKSVLAVGDTLAAAGTQIQSIADDLSQHIAGLQWTGAAADSFTGWARQVVSATDTLAVYTSNTSVAVTMAGQQLTTAQASMPPVPTADMATVAKFKAQQRLAPNSGLNFDGSVKDPSMAGLVIIPPGGVTQQQAYTAQTNVESAYQEALGQMESLGGSYVGAVSTMGVSTVPTFPPLPTTLMPPKGSGTFTTLTAVPGPGGATSGSGSSYGGSTVRDSSATGKDGSAGAQPGAGGVTFVPVPPPAPGGGGTTLQGTQPPVAPPAVTTPPAAGGGGAGGGTGGGGTTVTPPPVLGIGTSGGGTSGGGSVGGGSFGSGGSTSDDPGTGMVEGDAGISGGTPSSVGSRGRFGAAAIGDGEGAAGVSYGSGGVSGGSPAVSESAVAYSSTAQSGISGDAASGVASGAAQEAQGRSEMMGGGMGMGGMGHGGGSTKRRGRRAGYLVEDEETWTSGTPGVNPAVIE